MENIDCSEYFKYIEDYYQITNNEVDCDECMDIIFEEPVTQFNTVDKSRQRRYRQLVLSSNLPWDIREPLLDLFPTIERYFETSDRVNFVNLDQLLIELVTIMGREDLATKFKGLKTKCRVNKIKEFVKDCLMNSSSNIPVTLINDLPFLEPICPEYDNSKIISDDHLYSDVKVSKSRKTIKDKTKISLKRKSKE